MAMALRQHKAGLSSLKNSPGHLQDSTESSLEDDAVDNVLPSSTRNLRNSARQY